MKKYIALFVLLMVVGQFYYANANIKHENPILIQEYDTPTTTASADFSPTGGDGKLKITSIYFETVIILTLLFSFSFNRFIQYVKRRSVLSAKFYQSNYLITTSLKTI